MLQVLLFFLSNRIAVHKTVVSDDVEQTSFPEEDQELSFHDAIDSLDDENVSKDVPCEVNNKISKPAENFQRHLCFAGKAVC